MLVSVVGPGIFYRQYFNVYFKSQVQSFNDEEEAFGWDVTAYPQRQQLLNTLTPFRKLYETTVEFQNKYKYVCKNVVRNQTSTNR